MVTDQERKLFREVFNFLDKWKEREITSEALQELDNICSNSDYDKAYAQRLMFATCDHIVATRKKL